MLYKIAKDHLIELIHCAIAVGQINFDYNLTTGHVQRWEMAVKLELANAVPWVGQYKSILFKHHK